MPKPGPRTLDRYHDAPRPLTRVCASSQACGSAFERVVCGSRWLREILLPYV